MQRSSPVSDLIYPTFSLKLTFGTILWKLLWPNGLFDHIWWGWRVEHLRPGPKSARPLCFGAISRTTVRTDYVRDIGPADQPVWIQMKDTQAEDLIDRKPENGRNQLFTLTCLVFVTRSEAIFGAFQNEDQRRGNVSQRRRPIGQWVLIRGDNITSKKQTSWPARGSLIVLAWSCWVGMNKIKTSNPGFWS